MSATQSDLRRLARKARRRVARRWKYMRSPSYGFVDLFHDYRRTLLLVSSARSGSTWLSDVLEETLRSRMIFEPLRRDKVPLAAGVPWGRYSDPGQDDPELDEVLTRIMTGRVRSRWSDKFNRYRMARRRVVKEVRATNLLPRIVEKFPDLPVVYLLRHPVPTAWSAAELHWKPYLGEFLNQPSFVNGPLAPFADVIDEAMQGSAFHRHVLRWCLENYVPVTQLTAGSVHVVFYESVVEDPSAELERLSLYLARFAGGGWEFSPARPEALDRPSRANYRGTPVLAADERLQGWRTEVPTEDIRLALELVGAFGLDRIYGSDIRPLVGPDAVLIG